LKIKPTAARAEFDHWDLFLPLKIIDRSGRKVNRSSQFPALKKRRSEHSNAMRIGLAYPLFHARIFVYLRVVLRD
jgi:hypothetical protein